METMKYWHKEFWLSFIFSMVFLFAELPFLRADPVSIPVTPVMKEQGVCPPTSLLPQVQKLQKRLAEYQKKSPCWPQWTCTKHVFKKGDQDPVIMTVKKQLQDPTLIGTLVFDEGLEQAVIRFQKQHFLKPDGVIGPNTCKALNLTPADIIRKIKLNLSRWQKLSSLLNGRYILVNIPTYHLDAMEDVTSAHTQDVIVGMKSRPTPLFTTHMTHIILNPAWYVPDTIFLKDKLKKIQSDPNYLTRNHFMVSDAEGTPVNVESVDWHHVSSGYLPYRIHQLPGPHNALGVIKFYLDDKEAIYLHDTSQPELFQKIPRAFSSGCVRLSKPLELAVWALENKGPTCLEDIKKKIDQHKTQKLSLPRPIPVYFTYFTVWVDQEENLLLSDDPYNFDDKDLIDEGID